MEKAAKSTKLTKQQAKPLTKKPAKKAAASAPRKKGAPTKYTEELADEICTRIMRGDSALKIVSAMHLTEPMLYRWLREKEDFRQKYTHAREVQADVLAEEIVSIADELEIEAKYQGETVTFDVSATAVQRNRLRVDARKWYASKLAPKKYGDKLDTIVSGPDGGPVQVQVRMSDAERAVKLAYLLDKLEQEEANASNGK